MPELLELAKPILAVLYREEVLLESFISELKVERLSEAFYFESLQSYYSKEMGQNLIQRFLSLKGFIRKHELLGFKLWAMGKEREYALDSKRRINIDPGYVDESHLVLASSKKRGGRLYMGEGVCAEIEYLFVYGGFKPLYWTYADYRDKRVREFFQRVRRDFLEQLNLARQGKELVVYRFAKDKLHEEVKAW